MVLRIIYRLLRWITTILTLAQVLFYLPFSLDIAGPSALLSLSLSFAVLSSFITFTHLILSRKIGSLRRSKGYAITASITQITVLPVLLLLTLNLAAATSNAETNNDNNNKMNLRTDEGKSSGASEINGYVNLAVAAYSTALQWSSPLFLLLEGFSTLLVIQSISARSSPSRSRFPSPSSLSLAGSSSTSLLPLLHLVTSAVILSLSVLSLLHLLPSLSSPLTALLAGSLTTLLGVAAGWSVVTRGSGALLEGSLIFGWTSWQVGAIVRQEAEVKGAALAGLVVGEIGTWAEGKEGVLPPSIVRIIVSTEETILRLFGGGIEFFSAASSAIPIKVLLGLIYRLSILYFSSRIIVRVQKRTYHERYVSISGKAPDENNDSEGEQDKKRVVREDKAARRTTLLVGFSRLVLIAVYTNLLLLSSPLSAFASASSTASVSTAAPVTVREQEIFWRWINLFVVGSLWIFELLIGSGFRSSADADESVGWKLE